MQHTIKKLPKSALEVTIELSPEEMQPYLQKAATRMSEATSIPGFRPGKAPYDQVVARFGKGRIWEEAAQLVVPKTCSQLIVAEKLETIGSPSIEVTKLAPDNAFIFKATFATLPEVTLGDYAKLSFEKKAPKIEESAVDKVLEDLKKMQTKEVVIDRPATPKDKVVVDMSMSLDNVPLDGGTTKDHAIYLEEESYVPGLKEKLHGVKKGDIKEFKLKFPKEHYQKMIAGKDVDFKIEVKDVFELTSPELNDEFAKKLGQETVVGLRTIIRGNLEQEATQKEEERAEIALLEQMIGKTTFGEMPDILLNEETHKMLRELEEGVTRQGMEFTAYLTKIGKNAEQLRLEFAPEALKRVKVAVAVRKIAKEQSIEVPEKEIDAEVERMITAYKDQPDTHTQIRSEGARDYLGTLLRNRKVIAWLKEQAKK